jgi:hypothetical protein
VALIKTVKALIAELKEKNEVDNCALAPGETEARQWLRDFKESGYIEYRKGSNTFILKKPLPEEIVA